MNRTVLLAILISVISCKQEKKETDPLVIEYHEKGIEYVMMNKTDSALVYFNKALALDSTDILTYQSLVRTYWESERPEAALELLESVPMELQNSDFILTFKGQTLERLNRLDEAIQLYKTAFEQSPRIRYENEENIGEYIAFLIAQTVTGKKQEAIVELDKLKAKNLSDSERRYLQSIEPLIRNYKGGGYNELLREDNYTVHKYQ